MPTSFFRQSTSFALLITIPLLLCAVSGCETVNAVDDSQQVCDCVAFVKQSHGIISGTMRADSCRDLYQNLRANYARASPPDLETFKSRVRTCIADESLNALGKGILLLIDAKH